VQDDNARKILQFLSRCREQKVTASHDAIERSCSLSRPTVSGTIGALRELGLIESARGKWGGIRITSKGVRHLSAKEKAA
jgi:DNA-binding IscR family transcriptional regulator